MRAQIADTLTPLVTGINEVTPHPRNARQGDVGALSLSLQRFGQVRPIVVQKSTGHVLAGNHLYKAAKSLGWDKIAAVVIDVDDDAALSYLIADNRTADLGSYDDDVLASILSELAQKDLLEGTGYDGDDVDDLLKRLGGPEIIGGDAPVEIAPVVWGVVIDCGSESEQAALLTELTDRGLTVRALMS